MEVWICQWMEEGEGEGLLVLVFGVGWFGWMDYSACACMLGVWGGVVCCGSVSLAACHFDPVLHCLSCPPFLFFLAAGFLLPDLVLTCRKCFSLI